MSVTTTLSGALNATDLTLTVADASEFPEQQFKVWIDAEKLFILEGPTASTTWTIQRDVVSAVSVANDNFERDLTIYWGPAVVGGKWGTAGPETSVVDGLGLVTHTTASKTNNPTLFSTVVRDARVTFRFATDVLAAGNQIEVGAVHRNIGVGTDTFYRALVRMETTQVMNLRLEKVVANVSTTLVADTNTTLTHAADTFYRIAFECYNVSPTTVRAHIWADGTDEPASWLVSTTDSEASLQTVGSPGVRARTPASVSSVPVVYSFDDFQVSEIPAGVSHSNGATVKLIEPDWGPGVMRTGLGAPVDYGDDGALWTDLTNNRLYAMTSGTWRYATLT